MSGGSERIERVTAALGEANLDALVCALPTNVLLLSGYWPVVGASVALATRDGQVAVLAPEDERELAGAGWASAVRAFQPGANAVAAAREPLARLAAEVGIDGGRVGYEDGAFFEQSSYAAMYFYGAATAPLVQRALPRATLVPATDVIRGLRAAMTSENSRGYGAPARSPRSPLPRALRRCARACVSPRRRPSSKRR